MDKSTFDDRLPILQLGSLDIDLRSYSYIPADFSNYFPPYAIHEWKYSWQTEQGGETFSENGVRCIAPLSVVVQRLKLLGWSERVSREPYEDSRKSFDENPYIRSRFHLPPIPSFDALARGVALLDVEHIPSKHKSRGPLSLWHDAALLAVEQDGGGVVTEHEPEPGNWYRHKIEELYTATVILMLAMNPTNLEMPVTWWAYNEVIYGNLHEEDYADQIGAKRHDRVLIVTEGKSDTNIIQKSLPMLRPNVEDFFTFVDMSENYPFTGVGNLSNFYKGLHKIGVQNNVVVLFDNDAEGVAKYEDAKRLPDLPNIQPLKLLSLPSMTHFHTVGPTGEHYSDINGRAVSIKCLLDLAWESEREPSIRWTTYLKATDTYQGESIDKSAYAKRFLALTHEQSAAYKSHGLDVLLDLISRVVEEMASYRLLNEF